MTTFSKVRLWISVVGGLLFAAIGGGPLGFAIMGLVVFGAISVIGFVFQIDRYS